MKAAGFRCRRVRRVHRLAAGAFLLFAGAAYALPFPLSLFVRNDGAAAHTHVLMIDGGGRREQNYQSHLLHVKQLLSVLLKAGVRRSNVAIFSADGADPEEDLAVRDPQPEADFWLLQGTQLETTLGTPITYANSTVSGMTLEAATKERLRSWFEKAAKRLHAGDTLLLYVTDHGTRNRGDMANNLITLWGKDESISVNELREMLALLDPGVRVVALMSQCFSGSFANLGYDLGKDGGAAPLPRGNLCGYFSSTADRRAYGCYPENRGKDNVGHSFHFIRALESSPYFPDAHAQVLVTDRTPDVPLRTSDFYLENLLRRVARDRGVEADDLADQLLHEAWQNKAAWEPEIRLLDRIGHAVGYFSPRSLAELESQSKLLPEVSGKLHTYADAWKSALHDLAQENLQRFLSAQSSWRERLKADDLKKAGAQELRPLTAKLLADLAPFTRDDTATAARLALLKDRADTAAAASYRMEVRLGVVLRMRAVLTSIAGRVYIATQATEAERAAYQGLQACEALGLAEDHKPIATEVTTVDPFPSYDEELQLAQGISPAWMGIRFKQVNQTRRKELDLRDGAVGVMSVYPDSPAKAGGFEVEDIVLGPPDAPFVERNQIREWTMLSKVDEPAPLDVLRGDQRLRLTLVPKPFPLTFPDLPAPPKIGSPAVPLKLDPYRGSPPTVLSTGKPHLLFFWATWCAPCKASLPEVLAFERARHTQVVAITDELREQLDAFFKVHDAPFPETVAMDEYRKSFVAYGVSGTPAFVLVNGDGTVKSYATGYNLQKGLDIDGWSWSDRPAPPTPADGAKP